MLDPRTFLGTFVASIIEQAVTQLTREGFLDDAQDRPLDELIATAIGNRIARTVMLDRSPRGIDPMREGALDAELLRDYQELLEDQRLNPRRRGL